MSSAPRGCRGICSGEHIGCFALTEPGVGSDAGSLVTRAAAGRRRLAARPARRSSSPMAVGPTWRWSSRAAAARGRAGSPPSSCRLTPWLQRGADQGKAGLRGAGHRVVAARRGEGAGREPSRRGGPGFKVAMAALSRGRMSLAAGCVGVVARLPGGGGCVCAGARAVRQAARAHQLVQDMIADIAVETDAARALTWLSPTSRTPASASTSRQQGEVLRERGGGALRQSRAPGVRWIRVHRRVPGRQVPSRRPRHHPLRGHEPDPEVDHRPGAHRGERLHVRPLSRGSGSRGRRRSRAWSRPPLPPRRG